MNTSGVPGPPMDSLPNQDWGKYYSIEPKNFLFQGGDLATIIIVGAILFLVFYVWICSPGIKDDPTRSFAVHITIPIIANIPPQVYKYIVLVTVPWPDYHLLWVLTTIEYTLHMTIYLTFIGNLLLYIIFLLKRHTNGGQKYHRHYFTPLLLLSAAISFLHFNFDDVLSDVPLLVYFAYVVFATLLTFAFVMMIPCALSCTSNSKGKVYKHPRVVSGAQARRDLLWMYPFLILATAPTVYSTGMTGLDFVYIMFSYFKTHPAAYIQLANYRQLAFELNPIFILLGILILLPSYRRQLFRWCMKPKRKSSSQSNLSVHAPVMTEMPPATTSEHSPHPLHTYTSSMSQVIPGNLHRMDPNIFPGAHTRMPSMGTITITTIQAPPPTTLQPLPKRHSLVPPTVHPSHQAPATLNIVLQQMPQQQAPAHGAPVVSQNNPSHGTTQGHFRAKVSKEVLNPLKINHQHHHAQHMDGLTPVNA